MSPSSFRHLLSIISLATSAVHAALYRNAADLPSLKYDFVIVGSGAGGSVVANRLTENRNVSVLLLEAGSTNEGNLNVEVPLFRGLPLPPVLDWNYTSIPQPGLNNRTQAVQQGHTLGGSTSINGMIYLRGSKDDYNRYALVTGDPGWSWYNMLPYFKKGERWTPPADNRSTAGDFDPAVHGFNGPLAVSLGGFLVPLADRIKAVTAELPGEFPYILDNNGGRPLGVGWLQTTVDVYRRESAATAYLAPQYINRPNLHVLVNARVLRVLKTGTRLGKPVFKALEFSQEGNGTTINVTAREEIILSAGAINTPHILLHSGIGDSSHLSAQGIQPIVNLSDVGQKLSVQPFVPLNYAVNSSSTFDEIFRNATLRNELVQVWNETHYGPLVTTSVSTLNALLRLPYGFNFPLGFDPSAGPNTPHISLIFANNGLGISNPTGNYIGILVTMLTPTSRGSVTINSTDPFVAPVIDLGLLKTGFDIAAYREGVKLARRFVSAQAWNGFIIGPVGSIVNATTDAEIEAWLRANSGTTYHLVGTAAMSPYLATYGVVDPDLCVKRVSGLRVVDASVLPYVPAANTQAAVYGLAERAADLIKGFWGCNY
ncbi:GMC oxidoreductase [Sphaerobolus stellatus SS14]|nr:GMC oxidoreductase [Sphaerobolus stellatus SS14]